MRGKLPVRARLRKEVAARVTRRPGKRALNGEPSGSAIRMLVEPGRPITTQGPAPLFTPRGRAHGKQRLMSPAACVSFHAFAEELKTWEDGVPVDCGDAWDWEKIEAAVKKGPHKSAMSPESIALVREDVDYQVAAGYAQVLTWEEVKRVRPKQLKISPLAVIPQRERRGRMILDLSFAVRAVPAHGQRDKNRRRQKRRATQEEIIIQPSVNDTTVRLAPDGPVKELGNVLPRLLDFMAEVPEEEHIYFSKLDLADGYWRMIVTQEERWNFAYVMPTAHGQETLIVLPSALQMGWNESPAYFCATTETVRDVSQTWINQWTELPPHKMEHLVAPTAQPRRQTSKGPEHVWTGVYVDDHVMGVVENRSGTLMQQTARATLHAIHSVFTPPGEDAATGTKDPISEKKLQRGDGRWATTKEILGYQLDGVARTVQLPQGRADDLLKEVRAILKKKRVQLKRFRSIVGRLQHAARILPAARAFFTPLYNALRGLPVHVGLSSNGEIRLALLDVAVVIRNLANRPTHVSELTQKDLHYTGYCDASAFGAGGVWIGAGNKLPPIVWRIQWPQDVTADVVSYDNPGGRLTNSDLEMAGVLLQEAVLEARLGTKLSQIQMAIGCDNSLAVYWMDRMATRSTSPISFRLLKGLAMRQRTTRAAPTAVFHVAGIQNTLADVASRPIPGVPQMSGRPGTQCPKEFLTHFNSSYPLQVTSWINAQPTLDIWSNVIATLRGQRLALQRWMTRPDKSPGKTGPTMPRCATLTHRCEAFPEPHNKNISWPLPPGFALGSLDMQSKLDSSQWKKPSVTWHKPSCWRDTPTPDPHSQGPRTRLAIPPLANSIPT